MPLCRRQIAANCAARGRRQPMQVLEEAAPEHCPRLTLRMGVSSHRVVHLSPDDQTGRLVRTRFCVHETYCCVLQFCSMLCCLSQGSFANMCASTLLVALRICVAPASFSQYDVQVIRGATEAITKEVHALAAAGQLLVDWPSLNAAFSVPAFEGVPSNVLRDTASYSMVAPCTVMMRSHHMRSHPMRLHTCHVACQHFSMHIGQKCWVLQTAQTCA